jgi:hypothetical protein
MAGPRSRPRAAPARQPLKRGMLLPRLASLLPWFASSAFLTYCFRSATGWRRACSISPATARALAHWPASSLSLRCCCCLPSGTLIFGCSDIGGARKLQRSSQRYWRLPSLGSQQTAGHHFGGFFLRRCKRAGPDYVCSCRKHIEHCCRTLSMRSCAPDC